MEKCIAHLFAQPAVSEFLLAQRLAVDDLTPLLVAATKKLYSAGYEGLAADEVDKLFLRFFLLLKLLQGLIAQCVASAFLRQFAPMLRLDDGVDQTVRAWLSDYVNGAALPNASTLLASFHFDLYAFHSLLFVERIMSHIYGREAKRWLRVVDVPLTAILSSLPGLLRHVPTVAAALTAAAVYMRSGCNVILAGPADTGKTAVLRALSSTADTKLTSVRERHFITLDSNEIANTQLASWTPLGKTSLQQPLQLDAVDDGRISSELVLIDGLERANEQSWLATTLRWNERCITSRYMFAAAYRASAFAAAVATTKQLCAEHQVVFLPQPTIGQLGEAFQRLLQESFTPRLPTRVFSRTSAAEFAKLLATGTLFAMHMLYRIQSDGQLNVLQLLDNSSDGRTIATTCLPNSVHTLNAIAEVPFSCLPPLV